MMFYLIISYKCSIYFKKIEKKTFNFDQVESLVAVSKLFMIILYYYSKFNFEPIFSLLILFAFTAVDLF